jgi:hypothetical protein
MAIIFSFVKDRIENKRLRYGIQGAYTLA